MAEARASVSRHRNSTSLVMSPPPAPPPRLDGRHPGGQRGDLGVGGAQGVAAGLHLARPPTPGPGGGCRRSPGRMPGPGAERRCRPSDSSGSPAAGGEGAGLLPRGCVRRRRAAGAGGRRGRGSRRAGGAGSPGRAGSDGTPRTGVVDRCGGRRPARRHRGEGTVTRPDSSGDRLARRAAHSSNDRQIDSTGEVPQSAQEQDDSPASMAALHPWQIWMPNASAPSDERKRTARTLENR